MAIPTTVTPTVGHGVSSLRSAARPYSPVARDIATGRLIATGSFYHILPSSYMPASRPLTHAAMLPVGSINIFVGFTEAYDPIGSAAIGISPLPLAPPRDHLVIAGGDSTEDQIGSTTLPIAGGDSTDDGAALLDDADSATPASVAGSIVVASHVDSITRVSNASDFEDSSILGIVDSDSDSDSHGWIRGGSTRHAAVFMADGNNSNPPPDPFTTPLPTTATVTEVEAQRKLLKDARKKELAERERFRLEQSAARNLSAYHQQRMAQCLKDGQLMTRTLNFDDEVVDMQ